MDEQLKQISQTLTKIQVTQAEQAQILKDHVRRSTANEDGLVELRNLVLAVKDGFTKQLRPIQKHVDRVQFLFAIILGAGAIVGAVMTIISAIQGAMK